MDETDTAKKYLQLNDIEAYVESFKLSNSIWGMVLQPDPLHQRPPPGISHRHTATQPHSHITI